MLFAIIYAKIRSYLQAFVIPRTPTEAGLQLSQFSGPALCTCTAGRYKGTIAYGAACTPCSPHQYRLARSQSAETLLCVAMLHKGEHTAWQRTPIQPPITADVA